MYHYLSLGLQSATDALNKNTAALTQKINEDVGGLQQSMASLGLNDTGSYKVPKQSVTDIITRQAAAIDALDDPRIQEIRRIFDLLLSCKEAILVCIFAFNALVLIQGMSVIQSLRYTFKLQEKHELNALRRGKAGSVGPHFDTFATRLEHIILESTFTTKERLERLHKLADIQRMKQDSLRLFSSISGPDELQQDLKNIQELCAVGLLRETDPSRKQLAQELYTSYAQWRRVNIIRTLIYAVLRPYAGSVDRDENNSLGRREKWQSRDQHREKTTHYWKRFKDRLPCQDNIKTPKLATAAAIVLKMTIELDQQRSPDFSRYINKIHAKLCLLHYVPTLMQDLYFRHEVSVITLFDGRLFTIIDGYIGNKMNKHSTVAMLVN